MLYFESFIRGNFDVILPNSSLAAMSLFSHEAAEIVRRLAENASTVDLGPFTPYHQALYHQALSTLFRANDVIKHLASQESGKTRFENLPVLDVRLDLIKPVLEQYYCSEIEDMVLFDPDQASFIQFRQPVQIPPLQKSVPLFSQEAAEIVGRLVDKACSLKLKDSFHQAAVTLLAAKEVIDHLDSRTRFGIPAVDVRDNMIKPVLEQYYGSEIEDMYLWINKPRFIHFRQPVRIHA